MAHPETIIPIEISVVIGAKEARRSLLACIDAIRIQAGDRPVEILVAAALPVETQRLVHEKHPDVKVVAGKLDDLVPYLWKLGLDEARGSLVAFTNANLIPEPGWLDQMAVLGGEKWAGMGGPIAGPEKSGAKDWALYFARYSAYLPPGPAGPTHDIAGDNACYRREALGRLTVLMKDGFWEATINARLVQDEEVLVKAPGMVVRLAAGNDFMASLRMRFDHGRHFAATRDRQSRLSRLFRILGTPLVPFLLFYRTVTRVYRQRRDYLLHLLWAAPLYWLLLLSWSLGEMMGYLSTFQPAAGNG